VYHFYKNGCRYKSFCHFFAPDSLTKLTLITLQTRPLATGKQALQQPRHFLVISFFNSDLRLFQVGETSRLSPIWHTVRNLSGPE
jgi:hypothetical protein